MKIVITKGKLLKGDLVEVEFTKQVGENKPAPCSEKHYETPKKELKDAVAALSIHAALIGEFVPHALITDIENYNAELVKGFTVTGFTITGKDDSEGVIITAHKTLKTGKSLGFNTPIEAFNSESPDAYPFIDELIDCVETCRKCFLEYLNGNFEPSAQKAIGFPIENEA